MSRAVLLGLVVVLMASAPYYIWRGVDGLRSAWPTPITDFPVFYHASALVLSDDRGALYDRHQRTEVPRQHRRAVGNFYSPPGLALVYAPLTLLDRDRARVVFLALSVGAAAGLAGMSFLWRREFAFVALSVLAVASLLVVYDALYLGHPSLLLALASGAALLLLARGRAMAGGLVASLLGLKPSLALYPVLYLVARRRPREVGAVLIGGLLLVGVPFVLLTGPQSLLDYRALLADSNADAFRFQGTTTGGANLMFNWNAFIARLFVTDPHPAAVLPFYALTLGLVAYVWAKGSLTEAWLAAALATVLAIPHLLYYDWVIVLPAALAAACVTSDRWFLCLLVGLHVVVNISTLQYFGLSRDPAFIPATPYTLAIIAYMAWSAHRRRAAETAMS